MAYQRNTGGIDRIMLLKIQNVEKKTKKKNWNFKNAILFSNAKNRIKIEEIVQKVGINRKLKCLLKSIVVFIFIFLTNSIILVSPE